MLSLVRKRINQVLAKDAIRKNKLYRVVDLVSAGVSDKDNLCLLAIRHNRTEIAKYLIAVGIEDYQIMANFAAYHGNIELLNLLRQIEREIDMDEVKLFAHKANRTIL